MDFETRFATVLLVLAGIVMPIISASLTGIAAQRAVTGAITFRQINRHTWTHVVLTTIGLGCTLALMLLIGGPLGSWAILTGIVVFIAAIGGGINIATALERLDAYHADGEKAAVRTISSARSRAN